MQIRHLKISHFRGIESCEWTPQGNFLCLVGHGDATKSALLDAIETVLSPRYGGQVAESDFFNLDVSKPICIDVTLGNLPEACFQEEKFGMYLRGWQSNTQKIVDEVALGTEPVITVRYTVDDSFEPTWCVINDRAVDGRPIGARDRDLFGVVRIANDPNRHLTWVRGSALAGATEKGTGHAAVLSQAHRSARELVEQADLAHLQIAAGKAEDAAKIAGVIVREKYRPSLYFQQWGGQSGVLGLYDGNVPLLSAGLGTRRLAVIGLQSLRIREGSIILIDEIETGLEPHRLRHLLSRLRPETSAGQVFFTTHSAVTLIELNAGDIHFVRSTGASRTIVTGVTSDLQDLVRVAPEALLALRVLVAEGRTEVGITRGLEVLWAKQNGDRPLAHCGSIVVDGGCGTKAKDRAAKLQKLGLRTAVLIDSDDPTCTADETWQKENSVSGFTWPGCVSTEQRVFLDIPRSALSELIQIAVDYASGESVLARLNNALGGDVKLQSLSPDEWWDAGVSEKMVRQALGEAAKAGSWFKDMGRGEAVGRVVAASYSDMAESPLVITLKEIAKWLYEP